MLMVTEDGRLPTKNFLESIFSLAIFFHIHQMHAVESISGKTSVQEDESYMGARKSRPHSACNVETWIVKHATAQIRASTDHFLGGKSFAEGRMGKTASPPTDGVFQ